MTSRFFSRMKGASDIYRPGFRVWRSGLYQVSHYQGHRGIHQGELLAGEIFPYCKECKSRVRFQYKGPQTGKKPSLVHDLSFREKTPAKATAASLFKAAFGRRMTSQERSKIRNYEDNWD